MVPDRGDLPLAALVFLEGSESPNGGLRAPVDISEEAVARVTDALRGCDALAVSAIANAVGRYRRDGSWRNREAVIEAVTAAVVPVVAR